MKNWWKVYKQLTFSRKIRLIYIFGILCSINILLRWLPFRFFKRAFHGLLAIPKVSKNNAMSFDLWAVNAIAGKFPKLFTCLPKALATKFLLRNESAAVLKIGVQLENQVFEAHAWVEKEGEIIMGNQANFTFKPLWEWEN